MGSFMKWTEESDGRATQKKYLTNMSSEIKGFQIDTCFGSGGCTNRIVESCSLFNSLENLLEKEDILNFLKRLNEKVI